MYLDVLVVGLLLRIILLGADRDKDKLHQSAMK